VKTLVKTARGDLAAAACEPTAISVSAFERAEFAPGETVVVLGPGPIGLICAMIARSMGAGRVVVVGRSSSRARLDAGERVGLEAWDSGERDGVEAVLTPS
jgi:threonine dehydrogenase-like Zn-dependent dehydrogenase